MALDITTLTAAEQAQILYIGYFQRPAEPEGIAFWKGFLQNEESGATQLERLTNATDRFADADEASTDFPFLKATDPSQPDIDGFVTSIYQNLFNRNPEQDGREFYRGLVQEELANQVPKFSNIVLDIFVGANDEDLTTLLNKIAAADAYTTTLVDRGLVYDETEGENLVDTTTDQTADPAEEGANLASDNPSREGSNTATEDPTPGGSTTSSGNPPQSGAVGKTFTLTDQIDALTGTSGGDTFIGDSATLTAADMIDGAGGVDRFNILIDAAADEVPQTESVENIFVRDTQGQAVDFSVASGVQKIWSDRSSADTAFEAIESNATIGLKDTSNAVTATFAGNALGGASASVSLALDGSALGTNLVTLEAAGTDQITALNVDAIDGRNDFELADGIQQGLDTVNVSGSGSVEIVEDSAAFADIATFDASGNSGGVAIDLSSSNVDVTATGGSGDDSVTVDLANAVTVEAGAGDDVVTLSGATAVNLTVDDSIDGGDGSDTVVASAANVAALSADDEVGQIVNFEAVRTTTDLNGQAFNISAFGANELQIGAATTTAAATVSGFTDEATIEYRANTGSMVATDVVITNATNFNTPNDTLNVHFNADIGNQTTQRNAIEAILGVDGINEINVSAADLDNNDNASAADDGYILSLNNEQSVGTITVSGDRELQYTSSGNDGALANFNASSLSGDLRVNLSMFAGTEGVAVEGGSGNNTLTGSVMGDQISGGSDADVIQGGSGVDQLTGGAEADAFIFRSANDSVGTGDTITDFETGAAGEVIDTLGVAAIAGSNGNFLGNFSGNASAETSMDAGDGTIDVFFNTTTQRLFLDADDSGDVNQGDLRLNMQGVTEMFADDFVFSPVRIAQDLTEVSLAAATLSERTVAVEGGDPAEVFTLTVMGLEETLDADLSGVAVSAGDGSPKVVVGLDSSADPEIAANADFGISAAGGVTLDIGGDGRVTVQDGATAPDADPDLTGIDTFDVGADATLVVDEGVTGDNAIDRLHVEGDGTLARTGFDAGDNVDAAGTNVALQSFEFGDDDFQSDGSVLIGFGATGTEFENSGRETDALDLNAIVDVQGATSGINVAGLGTGNEDQVLIGNFDSGVAVSVAANVVTAFDGATAGSTAIGAAGSENFLSIFNDDGGFGDNAVWHWQDGVDADGGGTNVASDGVVGESELTLVVALLSRDNIPLSADNFLI